MNSFYQQLTSFNDFLDFLEPSNYRPIPENWSIIITDVVGSTQAIESGAYKTVNMIGASTIAAVANALKTIDIPIIFGGDGSTILIPADQEPMIAKSLRAVRRRSLEEFKLNLRIGIVPIKDILKAGHKIEVARFQLPGGPSQAFLKGSGVDQAEKWVKSGQYLLSAGEENPIDQVLEGLSCRWAPLQNTRGMMMSLLIKPRDGKDEILKKILHEIHDIVDLSSVETHPIKSHLMKAANFLEASTIESKLGGKNPPFKIMLFIFFAFIMRIFNLKAENVKMRDYVNENPSHSDYRKYDETLKMVIDCSSSMKEKILRCLEQYYHTHEIFYGYSISDSALLTCFVPSMHTGKHIHFVDGNDGGYTVAAKIMKQQISASSLRTI